MVVFKVTYGSLTCRISDKGWLNVDSRHIWISYSDLVDMIRQKFPISATPDMLLLTYRDKMNDVVILTDYNDIEDACSEQKLDPVIINVTLRRTTDTGPASVTEPQGTHYAGHGNTHIQTNSVDVHGVAANLMIKEISCFETGSVYAATVELPDGEVEVLVSLVGPVENAGSSVGPRWRLRAPAGPKSGHLLRGVKQMTIPEISAEYVNRCKEVL